MIPGQPLSVTGLKALVAREMLAEAQLDIFELDPYARRMAATDEGCVYLRLLAETAHNAVAWAHRQFDAIEVTTHDVAHS